MSVGRAGGPLTTVSERAAVRRRNPGWGRRALVSSLITIFSGTTPRRLVGRARGPLPGPNGGAPTCYAVGLPPYPVPTRVCP